MADESVYMDTVFVGNMAKSFQGFGSSCDAIGKLVEIAIDGLKVANLFGFGTMTFAISILEAFNNQLKQAASKFTNLSQEISAAVTAFENGDTSGASHFA